MTTTAPAPEDRWAGTVARQTGEAEAAELEAVDGDPHLPVTSNVTVAMLDELGPQHPVGIVEIAKALGVKRQTVDAWKLRDWFIPPSPTTLGSRPFWLWGDVRAWAIDTGRLIEQPTVEAEDLGPEDDEVVQIGAPRHPRTPTRDEQQQADS